MKSVNITDSLKVNNNTIERVNKIKYLEVYLDEELNVKKSTFLK